MWILVQTFNKHKYYCKRIEVSDNTIAIYLQNYNTIPHCFLNSGDIQSITFVYD